MLILSIWPVFKYEYVISIVTKSIYTSSFISDLKKIVKKYSNNFAAVSVDANDICFLTVIFVWKKPSNTLVFLLARKIKKIKNGKALELLNRMKVCVNLRYLGVWLFNNEIDFLNCWYSLEKRPNNKSTRVKHRAFERFIRGRVTRIT